MNYLKLKITVVASWATDKMTTIFTQNGQSCYFEGKWILFCAFAQLVTTFWNSTQKMRTWVHMNYLKTCLNKNKKKSFRNKTHLINRLDSRIDFDIQSGHLNQISWFKFSRLKIFISNIGFCIRCDLKV